MTSWVALAGTAALLGTLAVVDGCGSQPACANDAACGPAAKCDPEAKVCVQRSETTDCTTPCSEWQFCSETVCYPRYEKIVILDPTGAGKVDGGSPVRAQLQTVAPWVQEKPTAKLEFRVSNTGGVVNQGDLSPAGSTYDGHLSMTQQGTFTLTAGFPGFPAGAPVSDGVTIDVDIDPPVLTVFAPTKTGLRTGGAGQPDDRDPQLTNAFKRNDLVSITFGSDTADLDANSVTLAVKGMTTGAPMSFSTSQTSGCGKSSCFTAVADLSKVEMLALRGTMDVVATGRDMAGNVGTATAQIPVTRFKWSRAMTGVTGITASPAIGTSGTIYVGTTTGTLAAIKPDGTDQWAATVNLGSALLASPAVGKGNGSAEVVYAFPNGSPPVLSAFFGGDGSDAGIVTPGSSGSVQASPLVAITTSSIDTARESATTFLNSSASISVASLRFGYPTADIGLKGDAGTIQRPGNIVGEDDVSFAADSVGRVREYHYIGTTWGEQATVRSTSGASRGLALTSTLIAGATSGTVFAFSRTTGSPLSRTEVTPSIPAFIGADLLYSEGGAFKAVRVDATSGGSGVVAARGDLGDTSASPLVAKGQVSYFVLTDNAVAALDPTLATLWSGAIGDSTTVDSSPNIDCARATNGSKIAGPGTLYYGADNGKLYAIIVDNPGIDTTSPWPKYQHDPRNTGSLSTPLSEFSCPP